MPDYEVEITVTVTYTAVKLIKAKDEETAGERVGKALEAVHSLETFQKYIGNDSDIGEDVDCAIEAVTEV